MTLPTHGLKSIDTAQMPGPDQWATDATAFEEWAEELQQPFDDVPEFDDQANPEVDVHARLSGDRSTTCMATRRLCVDYRANPDAFRHLKRLPGEGASLHGIISGKYALWDLVPALIERTGESIADLYLATLGFSKANGADLCGLLDDRKVRRVSLICSYYFQKTSAGIYDLVVPELLARGQRVKAIRSHCKMILARMTDGRRFVCESSANLRSCVNIEQFVLTRSKRLYLFHRRWMEAEILAPSKSKPHAAQ